MTCICNPKTSEEARDLENYGCPEEICTGCYGGKPHDNPYCKKCMKFLADVNPILDPILDPIPDSMPKVLYLMQGVPGSGKSTIAKMIAFAERESGKRVSLLSADDWRYNDDGIYDFNSENNVRYHKACQQECARQMLDEVECIIIDNTNIQEWQVHPYLVMADIHNYIVQVVSVDSGIYQAIDRQALRKEDRRVPTSVIIDMYIKMERVLAPPQEHLLAIQQNAQVTNDSIEDPSS